MGVIAKNGGNVHFSGVLGLEKVDLFLLIEYIVYNHCIKVGLKWLSTNIQKSMSKL